MLLRPVKAECGAPVVYDQGDPAADAQRLPGCKQILTMFDVAITVRTRIIQLVRIAHADEIDRNAASLVRQVGHDITPEIGRGRIAVLKHDRIAIAHLDIRHSLALHVDKLLCWFFGGQHKEIPRGLINDSWWSINMTLSIHQR